MAFTKNGKFLTTVKMTMNFKNRMVDVAMLLIFRGRISPSRATGTPPIPIPNPNVVPITPKGIRYSLKLRNVSFSKS